MFYTHAPQRTELRGQALGQVPISTTLTAPIVTPAKPKAQRAHAHPTVIPRAHSGGAGRHAHLAATAVAQVRRTPLHTGSDTQALLLQAQLSWGLQVY